MKKIVSLCLVLCLLILSACSLIDDEPSGPVPKEYDFKSCRQREYNEYLLSEYNNYERKDVGVFRKEKDGLYTKLLDFGRESGLSSQSVFACSFFEADRFYLVGNNLTWYDLTSEFVGGTKESSKLLPQEYSVRVIYSHTATEIVLAAANAEEVRNDRTPDGQNYETVTIRAQRDGSDFKVLEKKIEIKEVLEEYGDFSICSYVNETTLEFKGLFQNTNGKNLVFRLDSLTGGWIFEDDMFYIFLFGFIITYDLSLSEIVEKEPRIEIVPYKYLIRELLHYTKEVAYVSAYIVGPNISEETLTLEYFKTMRDGSGYERVEMKDIPTA